jgi:hypothetical protein
MAGDLSDMEKNLIAKYAVGTTDLEQLNRSIAQTWRTILLDSKSRAEIAALLGVHENELDAENPPFRADAEHLSTTDPEILITLTAGRKARQAPYLCHSYIDLWRSYIHERVNPIGSNRLGQEKAHDEDATVIPETAGDHGGTRGGLNITAGDHGVGIIIAGGDIRADVIAVGTNALVTNPATTRVIDANFFTDQFVPGELATLTITIRLPQNPVRGRWQGRATFAPELGPIQIMLEAQGFTLISELPPPFDVPKDSDPAPVAFEFRIEEATHRWLHVMLLQNGRLVGELIINDFSAVGQRVTQQITSSAVRTISLSG